MPRNRSAGRPAPSWPTAPARAASAPQQRRPASTVAAPPATQHAPQQMATPGAAQSQGSGLFGQMASTAAGVAIGSSVGHTIGGFFSAGASEPAPQPAAQSQAQNAQQQEYSGNCQSAALQFNKCMDEQRGDMQICNWYLEQLKACQAAARPY